MKTISFDPSGTGKTGACIIEKGKITFWEYLSKDWKEHLAKIIELVKEKKPETVIFEDTTYIYGRQHQGTVGLYKLIGGIMNITYIFPFVKQIGSITVNTVKSFKSKLFSGKEEIEGLTCKEGRGKGWMYYKTKISLHQLDALIVYHLWSGKSLESQKSIKRQIKELKSKKRLGVRQKQRLNELENKISL